VHGYRLVAAWIQARHCHRVAPLYLPPSPAQITWRHGVVRKDKKTGLDEDKLTKTKGLLADAESHIVDFLAHYDKAAAASHKEGRESRYTSCSQASRNARRNSGGDEGRSDASTALSRVSMVASASEAADPLHDRKSVVKTASLHERARLCIVQASKEHLEGLPRYACRHE
jgi:hypothetical protein